MKIHQVLGYYSRSRPAAPMLAGDDRNYTYGQAADRIRSIAGLLREVGIMPGDRVAVLGENHPDQIFLLFAVAMVGAVPPLNAVRSSPRWRAISAFHPAGPPREVQAPVASSHDSGST